MGPIIILLLSLISAGREFSDPTSTYLEKSINKGNWNLGGQGSLSYETTTGFNTHLAANAEYFFKDRFSLGLKSNFIDNGPYTLSGLGLKSTYHFYETDRMSYFIAGDLSHYNLNGPISNDHWALTTGIGFNYFITPNIAFGPRLEWSQPIWDKTSSASQSTYSKRQINIPIGFSLFF